jgi:uncharacterized cupredoxin-like copper-binding protein
MQPEENILRNSLVIVLSTIALLTVSTGLVEAAPGEPGHNHAVFAAGTPGDPGKPARIVEIRMHETGDGRMLFTPDRVVVARGEQIQFVLKNAGNVDHEFMLDSVANNARHRVAMTKSPDMEHDDPNGRHLDPDESSEIMWRFTKAGTFEFACLIPGHYESGMRGTIVVEPR